MRVSRALIVTLALMVSPAAAAACEVVCGMPPAATADEHAHHGHHAAPVPEEVTVSASSPDGVSLSTPASECDLRSSAPARLRAAFTDANTPAAAITTSAYRLDHAPLRGFRVADATASPPAPPPHAPLPLRI